MEVCLCGICSVLVNMSARDGKVVLIMSYNTHTLYTLELFVKKANETMGSSPKP